MWILIIISLVNITGYSYGGGRIITSIEFKDKKSCYAAQVRFNNFNDIQTFCV